MNIKYHNIKDYKEIKMYYFLKQSNKTILLFFFIMLIGILVGMNLKYEKKIPLEGIIEKENTLKTSINTSMLKRIITSKNLQLNNDKLAYKIEAISQETIMIDGASYKEVTIYTDIPERLNTLNNILIFQILEKQETLFQHIINVVKGENT